MLALTQVSRTRRAGEAPRLAGIAGATRGAPGGAGTARWRKCGPAAQRRANGVAYSADNKASGLLRRLPEVLPRGLRRLWDGAPCPITLAQFPARQHLAGKIRFSGPALYYNYPLFTRSDAPFGSTTASVDVSSLRAMQRRRVESLVLGALSSSPVHRRSCVLVSGTNIAVLLCC